MVLRLFFIVEGKWCKILFLYVCFYLDFYINWFFLVSLLVIGWKYYIIFKILYDMVF